MGASQDLVGDWPKYHRGDDDPGNELTLFRKIYAGRLAVNEQTIINLNYLQTAPSHFGLNPNFS
jgi:hypothetical protein